MKRILWVLSILILVPLVGFSQKKTDANIVGDVQCKGEHIPYIRIALKGTTIGTITDATGHYFLKNLPEGDFTLIASAIGYKTVEKQVTLVSGKTIEVNFEIEEDAVHLEGVVVSANRNEVNRKEAPTIVNVITPDLFENTNSVCLADGLNFQPGVRTENNCQSCGFSQVRINGLEGPYSQILIDSRPIFSALAGVYGLEQIPVNMIERVEVMRGGGSALFGSNAIAGVINIITKEPTSNSTTVSHTSSLINGKKPDFNTSFNASLVSDDYKTGIMLFGSTRQRAPFDYDGDGFTEVPEINAKNIGFRAYYRTSTYSKLTLEYNNLGEFRRGGDSLELSPHQANIAEQIEHNIHIGGLNYQLFSKDNKHQLNVYLSTQLIDRKSYYGAQKNLYAYGRTNGKTFVSGVQYNYSMDRLLFMPAELTAGIEYNRDEMHDEQLAYNRVLDQNINIFSAFLQNEWKTAKWSILAGARLDKHSLVHNPIVSPRFNVRYNPAEWINMRASFSTGFRAPQTFDEDLHIAMLDGAVSLIELDSDLKPEKSQSYSASVDLYKNFGKVLTNLLIEGFYTNIDNVFVLEEMSEEGSENTIFEKKNGPGSTVMGINIEGKVVPFDQLQLQFGVTFQKSEYKEPLQWSDDEAVTPQKRMFRTPGQYGYLTLNYQPVKPLTFSLSGTYTGSMLVQHFAGYIPQDREEETPRFYDVNLKIAYDFKLNSSAKMQVNGGVQNIFNSYQKDFDKGEFRDSGYIYGPALLRTFMLGVKVTI